MNTTAEITQQLRLAAELIATLARDQDSLTAEQHAAVDAVLSGTTHEPPPFQLPPRPPGMRWHREDGWKAEDLPQGYRPHALGEIDQKGDQRKKGNQWSDCACATSVPSRKVDYHRRTTRPLVFTHEGKEWTYHRPGDPMPCDGEAFVYCLCDNEDELTNTRAKVWTWGEKNTGDIIGWRYAETTKQVELGPEDVPPFSVLRIKGIPDPWKWTPVEAVDPCFGIRVISQEVDTSHEWIGWRCLDDREINRSIPLTGKWDANAWEPCHKTLANG
jgi:hypothetical protein